MTAALQQTLCETLTTSSVPVRNARPPLRIAAGPAPTRKNAGSPLAARTAGTGDGQFFTVRHGLWRAAGIPGADQDSAQILTDDDRARLIAHGIIEVLAGQRPQQQLRQVCDHATYTALSRARRPTMTVPHLISVRVCEPADGVLEASAVHRRGPSVHLLAYRLERRDSSLVGTAGGWTVTAIHLA